MKNNMVMSDYSCPPPTHFYIDPCNLCNLRCPFCLTGTGNGTAKAGIMTLEVFTTIFEKIADSAEFIGLYNYGEPFMNPDILRMVAMVAGRGIRSRIDSNLTVKEMTDSEAEEIIKSGLTELGASIDGATQSSYGKYRIRGSFNTAVCNLERIQAAKKRLNATVPVLTWSFLINKFNEHEIQMALQRARGMGVHINFKLMEADPEWHSSYHADPVKLEALQKATAPSPQRSAAFKQLLRKLLATFHGPKGTNSLPMRVNDLVLPSCYPYWCKQPFSYMIISWNGDVFPCCVVHDSAKVMGNLLESSLEEIWNNTSFKNSRAFLHQNRRGFASPCELCTHKA